MKKVSRKEKRRKPSIPWIHNGVPAPEPPRRYQLQIVLIEPYDVASLRSAIVDVPDHFLGQCLFEAVYQFAIENGAPLRRISRTETYKATIP